MRQRVSPAEQLLATLPASVRAISPQLAAALPATRARKPRRDRTLRPGMALAVLPSDHPATVDADGAVRVELSGLRLPSLANLRATREKAAAVAAARRAVYDVEVFGPKLAGVRGAFAEVAPPAPPLVVTITRVAPRRFDDDNAVGSAKAVRDAVALWLGVDDRRDDLVRYEVRQERGPAAVRIVVARRTP